MVLVDTSVWVNHFRRHQDRLADILDQGEALGHPFVLGELACENLNNRKEILELLSALPQAPKVDDDELLFFIDRHQLSGRGIGLIDVHLLASCLLAQARIWTADKRLHAVAETLRLAAG
jgi:predicted nucleic acid-binding protein